MTFLSAGTSDENTAKGHTVISIVRPLSGKLEERCKEKKKKQQIFCDPENLKREKLIKSPEDFLGNNGCADVGEQKFAHCSS